MNTIRLDIHKPGQMTWIMQNKFILHYHNNNGPAVIWHDAHKEWRVNNNYHRLDGPAIEWSDGNTAYYINDIQYNALEYWIAVQEYTNVNQ